MIYAELWKRDAQRKEQKEIQELEQRKKMVEERNQVLGWQKGENERVRQDEVNRVEAEKAMLVNIIIIEHFSLIS